MQHRAMLFSALLPISCLFDVVGMPSSLDLRQASNCILSHSMQAVFVSSIMLSMCTAYLCTELDSIGSLAQ